MREFDSLPHLMKLLTLIMLFFVLLPKPALSADQNFASFVSPVRGREYWRQGLDISFLTNEIKILNDNKTPVTWLLQYDALEDSEILEKIKQRENDEYGLFLEVTPHLAKASFVNYDFLSGKWEQADKLFLSAYEIENRKKLIDVAFKKFKDIFSYYPKSVGAWYIDGWSLNYMLQKYQITSVLGLSDQYATDGYQVWGQYLGVPFYPSIKTPLEPAQNLTDKLDLVKIQWAPRHPLLSCGIGPDFSNYSTQVNDYYSYHNLGNEYFKNLLDVYTKNVKGKISQITLGIEVGELNKSDIQILNDQLKTAINSKLQFLSMSGFAKIYKENYPDLSPEITITASDKNIEINYFFSPNYRIVTIKENGNQKIVDLRFYNQSPYLDNDQIVPDKRQNLYRVVPAIIDSISLHNTLEIGKDSIIFEKDKVIVGDKTFTSKIISSNTPSKISFFSKINIIFGKLVPDIRASKIDGKIVFGLKIGPETLVGFKNFIPGIYNYPFPILESFLNLNKFKNPQIDLYSRQEDELESFKNLGKVIKKDSTYGAEKLNEELSNKKLFENSFYIVN